MYSEWLIVAFKEAKAQGARSVHKKSVKREAKSWGIYSHPFAVEKGHYCNSTEIFTACLIQGGQAVKFGDDRSFLVFFLIRTGQIVKNHKRIFQEWLTGEQNGRWN